MKHENLVEIFFSFFCNRKLLLLVFVENRSVILAASIKLSSVDASPFMLCIGVILESLCAVLGTFDVDGVLDALAC